MRAHILLSLLGLTAALEACDFITDSRSPAELVDYVHTTRTHLQILQRWWPLLIPPQDFANPAFGVLPFALPLSYQTAASNTSELADFSVEPTYFWCAATCIIEWRSDKTSQPYTISVIIDATGHIAHGQALLSSQNGDWLLWLDYDGAVSSVSLRNKNDGLLKNWHFAQGQGTFLMQRGAAGALTLTTNAFAATVETSSWPALTSQLAAPTIASFEITADGRQSRRVQYADGSFNQCSLDIAASSFAWTSLGVTATVSALSNNIWSVSVFYAPQQELQQLTTQIERTIIDKQIWQVHIQETRILRFGLRRHLTLKADHYGDFVQVQWTEDGGYRGSVRIRKIDLGWQIDGFWDNGHGDMIRLDGQALVLGYWLGSFSGWSRADIDTPTEVGEWTMLADGSFYAKLLFKQINDTLAPVSVTAPPEGALLPPSD